MEGMVMDEFYCKICGADLVDEEEVICEVCIADGEDE
jgi:hypothetical protein